MGLHWDTGEKYPRAEVGKLHTRQQERSKWRAVAPIQSITEVTLCADADGQTRRGGRWPLWPVVKVVKSSGPGSVQQRKNQIA